jgi:hypothetical protein
LSELTRSEKKFAKSRQGLKFSEKKFANSRPQRRASAPKFKKSQAGLSRSLRGTAKSDVALRVNLERARQLALGAAADAVRQRGKGAALPAVIGDCGDSFTILRNSVRRCPN